jgi:protein phosphatase-4 regulatory subunit 3
MQTEDGRKDPRVIVESEDEPERLLLETKIQKEDGFQKQQETLIVWQEPGSGIDMALSFQEAEGCAFIWCVALFLISVLLVKTLLTASSSSRRFVSSVQQAFHNNVGGVEDALSDDLAMDNTATISLPAAELGNLPEIESSMRIMSSTANGRNALAKSIMADDYIKKLIPLVETAEDLESLSDLHRLCNIMKTVILLNDTSIIEHAVSDDCVLGVVGALEYDPDFPSHKANHRHWLGNKGRFKEVVPIDDDVTLRKIHQTYRLQYLKDVVLARILDDPTFSVLNSLIFFNQVDIVQHLQSNVSFLVELFSIFNQNSSALQDLKKKKDAVLFIQQCCGIAKNIQPPARQSLYNNFLMHGLLRVIHFGLHSGDVAVRVGATDILISIIDHDPQMIRQTIYRQIHENQTPLTDSLVELLLVEADLGVKSQISEALKVLLDQGIVPQGPEGYQKANGEFVTRSRQPPNMDPQQELFLTKFYEQSASKLFKPLLDLEGRDEIEFSTQQASMFTYLVEILCFFIRQHHSFSRYFVMQHNIAQQVAQLLKSRERYLKLVAIRFFRALIAMQEEFYTKQMLEKKVLGPVLEVLIGEMPRDNLVCSACLELFEFIKRENMKDFIKYLVVNHRDRLLTLQVFQTFREIIMRYDQTQGYTANVDYFIEAEDDLSGRKPPPNSRLMDQITVDPSEEEYWNTSDPEDEGEQPGRTGDKTPSTNGNTTPSKPLVDYPSDEEADDDANAEAEPTAKADENGEITPDASPVSTSSLTPPERLSEKRRREEDDEDDLGKLMQNKRRNSSANSPSPGSTPGSTGAAKRRRSFTAGAGNGTPKKIAISLSPAVRTGGAGRSDDES